MEAGPLKLLREGHAANACVSLFSCRGRDWTVKDFSSRSFPVRVFLAPFLFWRELRAIRILKGVDGVPSEGFRIDRNAIAVSFVPGESLSRVLGREPGRMTVSFLKAMEDLMERVHRAGLVHLDARGTGNWVVRPDGTPGLIDFQAAVSTRWLPRGLRRILEDIDMSGVLKKWQECHPEAMGAERRARLHRGNRLRSLWRIKGYLGLRK
ncbi:MAG: hypothetical protein MR428_08490 [Mesosutterella sp.]|nr:hypothetical protein [Mesosutterella sp.]